MSNETKDVTLYCDEDTFEKIKKIAKRNDRTIIGQIRHWVKEDES